MKSKHSGKRKPSGTSWSLGIIGGGNMAEAITRGVLRARLLSPKKIMISDPKKSRLQSLQKKYGVRTDIRNEEIIKNSDVVVLAVKPQQVEDVARQLNTAPDAGQILISIAAGTSVEKLQYYFGRRLRIIRAMPNTPCLLGLGATGLFKGGSAKAADMDVALALFGTLGIAIVLSDEALLDTVTGLSGSGPAYVFYLIEALVEAGVEGGLSPANSLLMATQTVLGAAQMVKTTGEKPEDLRRRVSSPGGTTLEGIKALEEGLFKKVVKGAVSKAAHRAKELSK